VQPPGARMILAQARRAAPQGAPMSAPLCRWSDPSSVSEEPTLAWVGQPFEAYALMSSWTPALRAALASGLSRVAKVAPSRSASSR